MGLNFNDMLRSEGFDPELVFAFRHRPRESELFKVLPWLAAERHELFNAYQQTQSGLRVESALASIVAKGHVASFIGQDSGRATFVALYAVAAAKPLTRSQFDGLPVYRELRNLAGGAKSWFTKEMETDRPTIRWFELEPVEFYSHWKGRLVVNWPPPERSWWRRAHKNDLSIHAVHERSAFDSDMPPWHKINLTWDELKVLPKSWKALMSQWRGIYYIYDESDHRGYVGSAYGESNLMGRWENYGDTGHGGNKLLRGRNPENFRYSILERVSPDMRPAEVIALETSWKERLHTYAPAGLNDT